MLNERIEELVPSLELCLQLRALGMPQESVFYWSRRQSDQRYELKLGRGSGAASDTESDIAAPTSAELGRLLPAGIDRGADHFWLVFRTVKSALVDGWYWAGYYEAEEERYLYDTHDAKEWATLSEAATRAQMLIEVIRGGDADFAAHP